jgi:hypothetical protein
MIAALPLALLCGFSLGSAALSLVALARVRAAAGSAGRRALVQAGQLGETVQAIERALEALAEEVRELRQYPAAAVSSDGIPKPGLNLNRRSQALRMHRRGEASEQIAANLGVPRQEVDLLLKIHRIVMNRG